MMRSLRVLGLALAVVTLASPAAFAQPDWAAVPTFGTMNLETGFTPDPAAMDITLGGMDENMVDGEGCTGYIDASAPSVDLNFDTDGGLPLKIYVRSSYDTVILINTPSQEWLCNDDMDGVQAGVLFDDPESGNYNIFVGTYSPVEDGETALATVYVTELVDAALLDPDGQPAESASLTSGFEPDPMSMSVRVGGPDSNPEEGCAGFLDADRPTARLSFDTDGGLPLYLYAQSDSDEDLTLTVMDPDGEIFCNDDADGLQPGLMIDEPSGGDYAVWVGTFRTMARTEDAGTAMLFVSELEGPTSEYYEEEYIDDYEDEMTHEGGEDISLFSTPANGSWTLAPGFTPDPQSMTMEAGGPDAVSVSGCAGTIDNDRPDMNLIYGAGGSELYIYVDGEADTTMLINTPSGEWLCSDDDIGLNPAIAIDNPEEGLYNVWVGTYSQDSAGSEVTLSVSEIDPR